MVVLKKMVCFSLLIMLTLLHVGTAVAKAVDKGEPGTLKWSNSIGLVWSSPAIGPDGTLYVTTTLPIPKLFAVDPQTGGVLWSYELGGSCLSSPAVSMEGCIYVGASDWMLYAFTPQGVLKWTYKTEDEVASSPAIGADGTVYVASEDQRKMLSC